MKCSLVISDFLEEIFSLSVCVFSFYGRGDGGDGSFLQQGLCQDCCVQCSRPHLCQSLLATHRHVWLCLLWGSLLLSPGSWNTEGFVCVLQSLFPQCCVTFDGSMVGLMVTSSKRASAIPRSAAPRAPAVLVDINLWLKLYTLIISQFLRVRNFHSISQGFNPGASWGWGLI